MLYYMYANANIGFTEILHDSETLTDVEHCHDPGLFFLL